MFNARRRQPSAEALRAAKLAMKAATRAEPSASGGRLALAHPFFWAPFVLVGDAAP